MGDGLVGGATAMLCYVHVLIFLKENLGDRVNHIVERHLPFSARDGVTTVLLYILATMWIHYT